MSQRFTSSTQALIAEFSQRRPLRTGSLIVTLFGDSIAPRGGSLWLGTLIRFFDAFDISHRLVRTAVYRLVQNDILQNQAAGRRSYYSLTSGGKRQFDEATARIYSERAVDWSGDWCLVITSQLDNDQRASLRKDLLWLGFGAFGGDVLAHPTPDRILLAEHLQALNLTDRVLVFDGQLHDAQAGLSLQGLVAAAWDLIDLEVRYSGYLQQFQPLLRATRHSALVPPEDAFYIRTLMIHEYRKIILRDPGLPSVLLPEQWPGHIAYQLTQELYRKLAEPSEVFVSETFECSNGALPPANSEFDLRFGGLGLNLAV
ncbi:MAG: phenylacetic acid degradation operon negative regulatory protein PaaX [Pseudomonadales bacterium]